MKYSYGPYNTVGVTEQWIRITEGCPHNHEYCYEPKEIKVFEVPMILRNTVKILDMNFLVPSKYPKRLLEALPIKLDKKFIHYEFICGIDYRFLDSAIASLMKERHFERIRLAWDGPLKDQYKIKDALKCLYDAGYKPKDLILFMICNWKIPLSQQCKKLDLCKVWNVKVADCYYDNQTYIHKNFEEIYWTWEQAETFRRMVREHNQIVNFKVFVEHR